MMVIPSYCIVVRFTFRLHNNQIILNTEEESEATDAYKLNKDKQFLQKILFIGELTFDVSGHVHHSL